MSDACDTNVISALVTCLELVHILYLERAFEIAEMEWKDGQELQQQPKKVVAVQGRNSKERYDNTRDEKGMQGAECGYRNIPGEGWHVQREIARIQ